MTCQPEKKSRILVLGSDGFVGKSMCRRLEAEGCDYHASTHVECDLRNREETQALFDKCHPDIVVNLAAFLGGVHFGYEHAAEMFTNNMLMQINTLDACRDHGVKRLVNPIGSCVYPGALDLYTEDKLWDGPLHPSVQAFAMAKKAFVVASWAYHKQYGLDIMNLVMSNMYGPGDHFDPVRSHAVGSLVQKFVLAKEKGIPTVTVLGTGKPIREWLYVEDAVDALYRAMYAEPYDSIINIGAAKGYSIQETAEIIKEITEYEGKIVHDTDQMDGALCKRVDGRRGNELLNWYPQTEFEDGLKKTVEWYIQNKDVLLTKHSSKKINGGGGKQTS